MLNNHKTYPIRQVILPQEILSLSIASTLYEAAGSPQGNYSFRLVRNIHYRIGQSSSEIEIKRHWIEMAALSVLDFKRMRTLKSEHSEYSEFTVNEPRPSSSCVHEMKREDT